VPRTSKKCYCSKVRRDERGKKEIRVKEGGETVLFNCTGRFLFENSLEHEFYLKTNFPGTNCFFFCFVLFLFCFVFVLFFGWSKN
jgi:hypothetical protein